MTADEKGFAARWSKRKVAARQEENDDLQEEIQDQAVSDQSVPDQQKNTEEELLTEEDFDDVDFDALDKSSDYTRFAKANVPAAIQKKALRKLWESDSVFEVLDGMNDYDEDFTGNGLAGKVFKTAYKVGRGFLSDDEETKDAKEPQENSTSLEQNSEVPESGGEEDDEDPSVSPPDSFTS